ncbi:disulfide oxidoreductase [Calidifontibacillus erzurumensis]|uniref:Probable disulfide formation protein n=1 Tax=Calidifontibacillus erzurumensis TaxID=2741433 RepID=A0A8J8GCH9_9BACI|nr:disulfide oxidoreductase [Calidifontibacillus erzurumensis]NSL50877.1 disulfide bond formation protein B [Calidifontibacillus erzurumensis]
MKIKHLENVLFISWAVSLIATAGSLYFSEVLKFIPCELCWFQRIFMYPLVFIQGIAVVKKDFYIYRYVLPLSIIGGLISTYHYLLQKVPLLSANMDTCGIVPCSSAYINWLGFITIPFLALIAFIIITVVNIYIFKKMKKGEF